MERFWKMWFKVFKKQNHGRQNNNKKLRSLQWEGREGKQTSSSKTTQNRTCKREQTVTSVLFVLSLNDKRHFQRLLSHAVQPFPTFFLFLTRFWRRLTFVMLLERGIKVEMSSGQGTCSHAAGLARLAGCSSPERRGGRHVFLQSCIIFPSKGLPFIFLKCFFLKLGMSNVSFL